LIILVEFCGTILTYYNVKILGDAHKDNFFPMFQTGSGKAVLLSKDSIQKARAVLEGRK
jgi:breast cancer 2 susceptibility protein